MNDNARWPFLRLLVFYQLNFEHYIPEHLRYPSNKRWTCDEVISVKSFWLNTIVLYTETPFLSWVSSYVPICQYAIIL